MLIRVVRLCVSFWLVVALAMIAACSEPEIESQRSTRGELSESEVDRLLALGYLDVGPALADDDDVGVIAFDPKRAQHGVTMFTDTRACATYLMDMDGNVMHSWSYQPCFRWGNNVLLPGGDLVVMGRHFKATDPESARKARYVMRMNWNGRVVWEKSIASHHDTEVTPYDELMIMTYRMRSIPSVHRSLPVRDVLLTTLGLDGEQIDEVSLFDSISAAPDILKLRRLPPREFEGSREIDPLHGNSVEWIRQPGLAARHPVYGENNVMVCLRNQDSVVIFDWSNRRPIWSWGRGELSGPHDATMLPGGNILIFDNGVRRGWSRIIELDPIRKEIVWEYGKPGPEAFYTAFAGASQRLGNGNTLITESDEGRVFEVTPNGAIVWDFRNFNLTDQREPGVIVRARRFENIDFEQLTNLLESKDVLPHRID